MRQRTLLFALALLLLWTTPAFAAPIAPLVVLRQTGVSPDGLPVVDSHPDGAALADVLARGFGGTMLKLYQYEQTYLQNATGAPPEPAYLLLSLNEGGFPRFGFELDGVAKPTAGFVDLHESGAKRPTGRLGAMDQIFPHELAHVIVAQLTGPRPLGASGQVHAVGVLTDPTTAFDEGFAESMQILAVDDGASDTVAAARDERTLSDVEAALMRYREALTSRWAPGHPARITFPAWFSGVEQVMRYRSVKENRFARRPDVPDRLAGTYEGYLLESVLPGGPDAPPKTAAQMLSTEGVVSHLFWKWATNPALQGAWQDDAFYARFGVSRGALTPLENAYLKLFHAFYLTKPHTVLEAVAGYKATFPGEAAAVDATVAEALLGQPLPGAEAVWVANEAAPVGRSLFDQFLGAPQPHRFDLNAARLGDLLAVPGVTPPLAEAILQAGPYESVDDLSRVPGVTPAVAERFHQMADAYTTAGADPEQAALKGIFLPYLWRVLTLLAAAAMAGALLYRWVVPTTTWPRAAANGFAAALLGLPVTWLMATMNHGGLRPGPEGLPALLVPWLLCGLPAALWRLTRRRSLPDALEVLGAWGLAALPAAFLTQPWF